MDDLISRQAAIKQILLCENHDMEHDFEFNEGLIVATNAVSDLPAVDSFKFCDQLWKTAYERGKAETRVIIKLTEEDKESLKKAMNEAELTLMPAEIIHCKECVYYENETHGLCDLGGEWAPDDYCSYGRRPKHG